jgi:hypothetical protein
VRGRGNRKISCFEGKRGQEVIMLGGKRGRGDVTLSGEEGAGDIRGDWGTGNILFGGDEEAERYHVEMRRGNREISC